MIELFKWFFQHDETSNTFWKKRCPRDNLIERFAVSFAKAQMGMTNKFHKQWTCYPHCALKLGKMLVMLKLGKDCERGTLNNIIIKRGISTCECDHMWWHQNDYACIPCWFVNHDVCAMVNGCQWCMDIPELDSRTRIPMAAVDWWPI